MKGFKMIQTLITPLSQFLPIFVLLAIIFAVALLFTKKEKIHLCSTKLYDEIRARVLFQIG